MLLTVLAVVLASPACPSPGPAPACEGVLPVYAAGCAQRWVCPGDLAAQGLTRIDLSDAWLPTIFRPGTDAEQPYRAVYRQLAAGEIDGDLVEGRAETDRYFEPYGIPPTLSQVRLRLLDAKRHACHEKVDDVALAGIERLISAYEPIPTQSARVKAAPGLERQFARELARRAKAADPKAKPPKPAAADFLKLGEEKAWAWRVDRWQRVAAVRATQAHLVCDRLMKKNSRPGLYDFRTWAPLQAFQRKHMLGSRSHVDAETRDLLVRDSLESDFHALLRALRERVQAASGIIEDGSALGAWGTVFGRQLATEEYRPRLHGVPLANGAGDFLSPATEAVARALGWTSPADAVARLADGTDQADLRGLVVAVQLPPPPPWHGPFMDLRAEVDRGDVWYDYPIDADGKERAQPVSRRPSLTLYARHGEREIALVRWPTTIGSWKPEKGEDGETVYKYKNSDVGPRMWRSLVAAPSWFPPDSTPDEELVERGPRGRYEPKHALLGPSYASAYGLVMLINERRIETPSGEVKWWDNGIRVHGSVSYRSIVRGTSHGCHRLFNHLAVRLSTFLLAHRAHTVDGPINAGYFRSFEYKGRKITIRLPSRGFGYTLDPPVPVEVLRGRVRGRTRKAPADSFAAP